jgi:hypothetical protein
MASETMRRLHNTLANHAGDIAELFTEPVRVTIVVRNPQHPDGSRDVHVSDDDPERSIEAIRRVLTSGVHVGGPPLASPTAEPGTAPPKDTP